jgi:hypothetical protein
MARLLLPSASGAVVVKILGEPNFQIRIEIRRGEELSERLPMSAREFTAAARPSNRYQPRQMLGTDSPRGIEIRNLQERPGLANPHAFNIKNIFAIIAPFRIDGILPRAIPNNSSPVTFSNAFPATVAYVFVNTHDTILLRLALARITQYQNIGYQPSKSFS